MYSAQSRGAILSGIDLPRSATESKQRRDQLPCIVSIIMQSSLVITSDNAQYIIYLGSLTIQMINPD
jgi:hypothetical protein